MTVREAGLRGDGFDGQVRLAEQAFHVAEALKRELKDMKGVSTKVVHRDLVKGR